MNKGKIAWLIIILLLFIGVGVIPLSILSYSEKRIDLYYEDPTATAPVVIQFSAKISQYNQGTETFFRACRSMYRGTKSYSGSITLKIGEHFSETISVKPEVSFWTGGPSEEDYICSITATFQVPASKIVPYMTLATDTDGNPITDSGSSTFQATYKISVHGFAEAFSGSSEGSVSISIVGSVDIYLPEAPEPTDPEATQTPENPPVSEPELGSTDVKDDDGGSYLYTTQGAGFMAQISIPVLVTVIAVVILIARKK